MLNTCICDRMPLYVCHNAYLNTLILLPIVRQDIYRRASYDLLLLLPLQLERVCPS